MGENGSNLNTEKTSCCEVLHSSNVNEVIRLVLNFLIFFYKKISQVQKSTKSFTANKN